MKTCGYLVSCCSVLLLGIVAWESAAKDPRLMACLILGMSTSLLGMFFRWIAHRREQKMKQ